jgi:hypothetical protein
MPKATLVIRPKELVALVERLKPTVPLLQQLRSFTIDPGSHIAGSLETVDGIKVDVELDIAADGSG